MLAIINNTNVIHIIIYYIVSKFTASVIRRHVGHNRIITSTKVLTTSLGGSKESPKHNTNHLDIFDCECAIR